MNISLEQAERLFWEANNWTTGKEKYLATDSEIRFLAIDIFHKGTASTITHVCSEIFRVIAEHAMENRV